jgi:5-methylcytosine-specific restriction endonuclease McrA
MGNLMAKKKLEWTQARLKNFIISALRSASNRYPPKYECLNAAKVGKKVNKATGRLAEHYKCAACKKHFVAKEIQVDHIEPVVNPLTGFIDWNTFVARMFCPITNLQVLCKECHKVKSDKEKKERLKWT